MSTIFIVHSRSAHLEILGFPIGDAYLSNTGLGYFGVV